MVSVVATGPDFILLPDIGPSLDSILSDGSFSAEDRIAAFSAAGTALGQLHTAGLAHGRPALRDMCWKDGKARMIDLERFRPRRRLAVVRSLDLVTFVQSWFSRRQGAGVELDAMLNAYRAAAPPEVWHALWWVIRALAPLGMLARAVLRLRPGSRELRAAGTTLAYLRAITGGQGAVAAPL